MTASQRRLERYIYFRKSYTYFTFLTCDAMLKSNKFFWIFLDKGLQGHRINSRFYRKTVFKFKQPIFLLL